MVGGILKPLTPDQVQFWIDRREKLESGIGEITEDEWIHERKKWTGLARKRCHPGAQQPCAVCNQYRVISHAHHLAPLGMQFDRGFVVPVQ